MNQIMPKTCELIEKLDNRHFQALYLYKTTPGLTQAELAEIMGVSPKTIQVWLRSAELAVNEEKLIELSKKRVTAMLPKAIGVYDKALDQGQVKADFVGLSAAKDILKNKGVLQDKVEVEHTLKSMDDKDLMDELKALTGHKAGDGGIYREIPQS